MAEVSAICNRYTSTLDLWKDNQPAPIGREKPIDSASSNNRTPRNADGAGGDERKKRRQDAKTRPSKPRSGHLLHSQAVQSQKHERHDKEPHSPGGRHPPSHEHPRNHPNGASGHAQSHQSGEDLRDGRGQKGKHTDHSKASYMRSAL